MDSTGTGSQNEVNSNMTQVISFKKPEEKNRFPFVKAGIRCERSFFLFSKQSSIRRICFSLSVQHEDRFDGFILIIIIFGSVIIATETYLDKEATDGI